MSRCSHWSEDFPFATSLSGSRVTMVILPINFASLVTALISYTKRLKHLVIIYLFIFSDLRKIAGQRDTVQNTILFSQRRLSAIIENGLCPGGRQVDKKAIASRVSIESLVSKES